MNDLPEYLKQYKTELEAKSTAALKELYQFVENNSSDKAEVIKQVLEERERNSSSGSNDIQIVRGFDPDSLSDRELLEEIDSINNAKGNWKKI